ncbi:hypothetical protein NKH52_14785 [Mesorhizobium sp. M1066]|uniref:hypothetical protein n=1 Tax=unclassified Mesorhizobium TaxID=325217 RepID=UPI00333B366F
MFLGWNRMGEDGARPAPNTFRDSMVVEILNPKTALFFLTSCRSSWIRQPPLP